MIKLSLLIPTLDRSGAEKQLVQLAVGLSREEFDVEVVALTRGGPLAEVLAGHQVPLTVLGKRFKISPAALLRLKRHLRRRDPDILHTWLFAANTYGRLARTAIPAARVVVSERCVDTWKRPWQKWLDRRLIGRTDLLLANSKSVAEFYRQLGVPGSLIEVIPNGIDVSSLPRRADATPGQLQEVREELGVPADAQLVTYVGRLAAQKRIEDLLWAIELLYRRCPQAWLICVGDGPRRPQLERFAEQSGAADRVRFTGHRDDVARLWAASDVAWLASDFEGQSNSVMEAMAAGLPVVASDIPANRELVLGGSNGKDTDGPGQTGHLVPFGDAAEFARRTAVLLEDPPTAQRLGAAGRQRMLDAFSLDHALKNYAALYRRIAAS